MNTSVETNESDQGSKVGMAVAAADLGLSAEDWELGQLVTRTFLIFSRSVF